MSKRTAGQLKHLELVQTNIARMHAASTSMKRFAIAGFALGASLSRFLQEPVIVWFTIVMVFAFWMLDAKYLQFERAFRDLYERVRAQKPGNTASFEMNRDVRSKVPFREIVSWSTLLLYGPLLVLLVVVSCAPDWEPRKMTRSKIEKASVLQLSLQAGQLARVAGPEYWENRGQ